MWFDVYKKCGICLHLWERPSDAAAGSGSEEGSGSADAGSGSEEGSGSDFGSGSAWGVFFLSAKNDQGACEITA